MRAVAIIQKKMPEDWRAAMTYLEGKHPKRWGRRVDFTSGEEPFAGIPVEIKSVEDVRDALRAAGVDV